MNPNTLNKEPDQNATTQVEQHGLPQLELYDMSILQLALWFNK